MSDKQDMSDILIEGPGSFVNEHVPQAKPPKRRLSVCLKPISDQLNSAEDLGGEVDSSSIPALQNPKKKRLVLHLKPIADQGPNSYKGVTVEYLLQKRILGFEKKQKARKFKKKMKQRGEIGGSKLRYSAESR